MVRPLMSYGKDERDIDKHIWQLPIPKFDPANDIHRSLADLAGQLLEEVNGAELDITLSFIAQRRRIRGLIKESVAGQEIEELVAELLG